MITKHSIMGRVVTGKVIGFVVGALCFFGAASVGVDLELNFRLGLWLFYITLGALIGLVGVMTHHPLFGFATPFWLRGLILGAALHLMLVLLAYDQMAAFMQMEYVQSMGMSSPFWILIDGAILGMIIDGITTKRCGEGDLPTN